MATTRLSRAPVARTEASASVSRDVGGRANPLLSDALRRIDPVSLDGLDAVAALRCRVDRKYLIDLQLAALLVDEFATATQVLEIDGHRSFGYDSVYYDTPERQSYLDAAHGRRRRYKVRTRTYLDHGTSALEVKTRGLQGTTIKNRMELPNDERSGIPSGVGPTGVLFVDQHTGVDGLGIRLGASLRTRYRRSTLLDPIRQARITIDTDVELSGIDREVIDAARMDSGGALLRRMAIVETKAVGPATDQDRWLWSHGYRPSALSKYCVGMALIHPDLPANRWRKNLAQIAAASGAGG